MMSTGTFANSGAGPDRSREREPVHAGHLNVRQDHVDRLRAEALERLQAVGRDGDLVAGAFEDAALELADGQRVVDDQDVPADVGRFACGVRAGATPPGGVAGPIDEARRVEDDEHRTVGLDARARHDVDPRQHRAQPLDHRVAMPRDRVDLERVAVHRAPDDDDRAGCAALVGKAEQLGERSDRNGFTVEPQDDASLAVERRDVAGLNDDDSVERHGEALPAGVGQEARQHRRA